MAEVEVCPIGELPEGSMRIVSEGSLAVGVYHCGGALYAIEDRCSHDDGPLCEGEWDKESCVAVCPRHGARIDIRSGLPLTLPAYLPVDTFPARVRDDGIVVVDLP